MEFGHNRSFESVLVNLEAESSDESLRVLAGSASLAEPTDGQIARLARALSQSGKKLEFSADKLVADIASTGGPASLSTLLAPLAARSLGAIVPKAGIVGRPAGGIDVMAQIPGYKWSLLIDDVQRVINECGYAHFLSGGDIAPLDTRFFSIRQAMGAQNIPALAIASILSKKCALGVTCAGIDVRVGEHGNFARDKDAALVRAKQAVRIGKALGIRVVCFVTDNTMPPQPFIGRGESLVGIAGALGLHPQPPPSLITHFAACRDMAMSVCRLAGVEPKQSHAQDLREVFAQHLTAHGACLDRFIDQYQSVLRRDVTILEAQQDGWIRLNMQTLRTAIVTSQAQYRTDTCPFPDPWGVELIADCRRPVKKGAALAIVRSSVGLESPVRSTESSISYSDEEPECYELIEVRDE